MCSAIQSTCDTYLKVWYVYTYISSIQIHQIDSKALKRPQVDKSSSGTLIQLIESYEEGPINITSNLNQENSNGIKNSKDQAIP